MEPELTSGPHCRPYRYSKAMASYEKNGLVVFPVDGTPRKFRFSVTAADNKMRIWMEDCVSKEQWKTKDLAVEDIVTVDTAIAQAKAKDYAVRVGECLAPSDDSENVTRSLSRPASDHSRVLHIGFMLHMGTFSTSIEYTFTLPLIPLDTTDLLVSRVRDLEAVVETLNEENKRLTAENASSRLLEVENFLQSFKEEHERLVEAKQEIEATIESMKAENDRLSAQNAALQTKYDELNKKVESSDVVDAVKKEVNELSRRVNQPVVYTRATLTADTTRGSPMVWKIDANMNASVTFETSGEVCFMEQGIYEITMLLMHSTFRAQAAFELLQNGQSVLSSGFGNSQGDTRPLPLHHILEARPNDKLKLLYVGDSGAHIGSYMTIYKLPGC